MSRASDEGRRSARERDRERFIAVSSGVTRRLAIFGLGVGISLTALACKMDNPAFDFDGGTELADETRGSDSSNPSESGESPGDGDGDGDDEPSESSTDDPTDPTDPTDGECTPGTSCGPCQICDDTGECVIDVGGHCDGPTLNCGDYLAGPADSICYRLTDVELVGRCSEQGVCESAKPSECPPEKGAVHFACDPACVTDLQGCTPFAKAGDIKMEAMCAVGGETTQACTGKCTAGIEAVAQGFGCVAGECMPLGDAQFCGPYLCDEQGLECLEACETVSECTDQFTCADSQSVPP
jgi:hypothetical protein